MTARQLHCSLCGAVFYGRGDARYCSGACRQKAYRNREVHRAALGSTPTPKMDKTVAQAQKTRRRARAARQQALEIRRAAAKTREAVTRQ